MFQILIVEDDKELSQLFQDVYKRQRQYNRRILNGENTCHVYAIQESNSINRAHLKYFGAGMDDIEKNAAKMQLEGLLDTLTAVSYTHLAAASIRWYGRAGRMCSC